MNSGIYLHIPFCRSRCSYCDFATDVYRNSETVERYVAALCSEIDRWSYDAPPVDTIYFGGGTPSLLEPAQVEQILAAIDAKCTIRPETEITMEMNPATVTLDTLASYRQLGVNRASFGVQTFDDRSLKVLARGHNANDAEQTFELLKRTGFTNISFDLICGLPGQTLESWHANLDKAVSMSPDHLSLYLLEIHQGTPLAEQVRSGRQPVPDAELAAEMYEAMLDKLSLAGYEQYEISNFSKTGFESRHNSKYWRLDPVFGFGVSAHSFDGTYRFANERDTAAYVDRIAEHRSAEVMREMIDVSAEFVFLGLRLEPGIDLREYQARFDIDLLAKYEDEISALTEIGLVEIRDDSLKLTLKGKLFSNEVFQVFV